MRGRLLSLLTVLSALALPASAQVGTTNGQFGVSGGEGLRIQARLLGEEWAEEVANGSDVLAAGVVGSGKSIDGLEVRHLNVAVRLQVQLRSGWLPWTEPGVRTGKAGEPIVGVRLRAAGLGIRYRGSFVGKKLTGWVADGDALASGGAPLEAIQIELLATAPKDAANFEYRVMFAGTGFTPWLKAGEPALGTGSEPRATALEVRNGGGIRTETRHGVGGFGDTAREGEIAGDPTGARPLQGIRIYPGTVPLRYRLKVQGSGWGLWMEAGADAGVPHPGERIEGIQLDLKRATP